MGEKEKDMTVVRRKPSDPRKAAEAERWLGWRNQKEEEEVEGKGLVIAERRCCGCRGGRARAGGGGAIPIRAAVRLLNSVSGVVWCWCHLWYEQRVTRRKLLFIFIF